MLRAGVDLGGTKIQTVILAPDNAVVGSHRCLTPTEGGPEGVAEAIAEAVELAIEDGLVDQADIVSVGVGSPGQIDLANGTVSNAGNLPGWREATYPLAPVLTNRLGIPTRLGNDVQVAVRAEAELGAGLPYNSFLGVFAGTGIGGGVVLGRELLLGRGAAGEIGHMVIELDGAQCNCGRLGCAEAYAGRSEMENIARRRQASGQPTVLFDIMAAKGRTRLTSGVWAKAMNRGDELAIELIDGAVRALGAAIGSAVNLLDVEAVVIGGGLGCRLGDPFVQRISAAAVTHMVLPDRAPAFHLAELGDLGGAIGAALLDAGE